MDGRPSSRLPQSNGELHQRASAGRGSGGAGSKSIDDDLGLDKDDLASFDYEEGGWRHRHESTDDLSCASFDKPYLSLIPAAAAATGELGEVIEMVEGVMAGLKGTYSMDRESGDFALGSVTQFVYKKLGVLLDEIAPHHEAPVVRKCLDEFMGQPSCVFQKPDVLRAVLGCLPFR